MLNEEYISQLLQPIVDRQEYLNMFIILKIADRLRDVGTLRPSDLRKLQMLYLSGSDVREINLELARIANMQVRDIKNVIKITAADSYIDVKPFYDYRHKSYIPFEKNERVQNIVSAIGRQTEQTYRNISDSRAIGYIMDARDSSGTSEFLSIEDTYQRSIDTAIQAVQLGIIDPEIAVQQTIKQLLNSGLRRLYWQNGRTQRLDTAVRRNVLDGIRTLNIELAKELGAQIGADGIELSAHANSAPDHEPFQGHRFTLIEFDNLQNGENFIDERGNRFLAVERAIGMWNCYHFITPVILAASKPHYTTKQLQKFIDDNKQGMILQNGKHLTMYECKQMQRRLETRIRYAKEEQMAMRELGADTNARLARNKVVNLTDEYKIFSKYCGLKPQMKRASVPGYHV